MVGKIRGFLFLFFVFIVVSIGVAVMAFVDLDETWSSVKTLAMEAFPLAETEEASPLVGLEESLGATQIFTDAIYEALKSGKAKPDDLLALGQLYFKSQNDGQLEDGEMEQMIDLAKKTGIMDAVIEQAMTSTEPGNQASQSETNQNIDNTLQNLRSDFQTLTTDGRLSPDELLQLFNKARDTDVQQQITRMIPSDYDMTKARAAISNVAKAAATGATPLGDVNALIDMFMDAQQDGRLERWELDQITQTAEKYGQ